MKADEARRILSEADLLIGEADIVSAIERLATEITARLRESDPVVICVMNGGLIFGGQLITRLAFPLVVDYVHATRYGHETRGARLNWLVRPQSDLRGRTVLLVDDILDEGFTLAALAEFCREQGAREVLLAALVDKRHSRKATPGMRADFTGFAVEDRFVFGYGLDYRGYWRNAPGIYAVRGL